ncbi:hypothetical protein NLX71_26195, partial [Paenibacillus sp. MZ04-78.2]|uniref:hypothetical protein n=1 Tax=Paenibacillus sp. MZ04-78.2 TaxID=2962034 RepID=UPI0020B87D12
DITPSNARRARIHAGLETTADGGAGSFYVDSMSFRYDMEGNLLSNPSFEANTGITSGTSDGWDKWKNTGTDGLQIVSSPVASGTKAQKIASSDMKARGAIWALQDIVVDQNKPFVLSGNIYVESLSNANVSLLIQFFDDNNNYIGFKSVNYPQGMLNRYMTLSMNDITPSNARRARIHAGLETTADGGAGSLYVDSMSFRYDTEGNLLSNPSFEANTGITSGTADGWNKWKDTGTDGLQIVSSPVASGTKAQKIASSDMKMRGSIWALQDIVVDRNKPFVFSGNIYVESLSNANVTLLVQFFDDNNNFISLKSVNYPQGLLNSNMTLSMNDITPNNARRARIHAGLQATADGGAGSLYVDSMSFRYDTEGNLLSNPSFEANTGITSGTADGWNKWKDTGTDGLQIVSSPVASGTKAQKIASSDMKMRGSIWALQDIVVDRNKPFVFSGNIYVESLSNANVTLLVQFF